MSLRILTLCCCFFIPACINAELPPGSYDQLRKNAEEAVVIQITSVRVQMTGTMKNVTLGAKVIRVGRTKSGLAKNDSITIKYDVSTVPLSGPRPVPILFKNQVYPGFLKRINGSYVPAAYGESFNTRCE